MRKQTQTTDVWEQREVHYQKLYIKYEVEIDPIVMLRESLAASIKWGDISPEKLIKIKEILDNA